MSQSVYVSTVGKIMSKQEVVSNGGLGDIKINADKFRRQKFYSRCFFGHVEEHERV